MFAKTKSSTTATAVALAIAGLAATHAAQAADNEGWYGSLSLGRSHLGLGGADVDNRLAGQGISSSSTIRHHDEAWSLAGGYQLNRNFALEGSYVDLGRFKYQSNVTAPAAGSVTGSYNAHGYGLSAVGILPLQRGFSIYGKAGLVYTRSEIDASSSAGLAATGATSNRTVGTIGAGLSYDFTKNIFGKAEWNRYARVGDSNTGRSDIDLYTVGMGYRF